MGKVAPLACLILGMQSKNLMALSERWLTVTHVAGISRIDVGWVRGSMDLKTLGKKIPPYRQNVLCMEDTFCRQRHGREIMQSGARREEPTQVYGIV